MLKGHYCKQTVTDTVSARNNK